MRFRNKIFALLQKTNERVHLDRPFLIREKMQVIMHDAESGRSLRASPERNDATAAAMEGFGPKKILNQLKTERLVRNRK